MLQIRAPDLRYEQTFSHSASFNKFTFAVEPEVYNRQYKSLPTSPSSRSQPIRVLTSLHIHWKHLRILKEAGAIFGAQPNGYKTPTSP
jgi:hypothetical protein